MLAALALVATPRHAQVVLEGYVVDGSTGRPVLGAHVLLTDRYGTTVGFQKTDSAGRFDVERPQNGRYRLYARAVGYEPSLETVLWMLADRDFAGLEVRHRHLDQTIAPVTGWRVAALGGGLLLLLAGCPSLNGPATGVTVWQATLQPDSGHPGLSGQAALAAQQGGTDAGIGITGGEPGATLTWQVRVGDCVAPGPGVSAPSAFPVLTVASGGGASGQMHIGHLLSADTAYYAEVRQTTDSARILCGAFQLQ